jgi:hypothetical protein
MNEIRSQQETLPRDAGPETFWLAEGVLAVPWWRIVQGPGGRSVITMAADSHCNAHNDGRVESVRAWRAGAAAPPECNITCRRNS